MLGRVNMVSSFLDNGTAMVKSGEFLEQAGGYFRGQAGREAVMGVPGLFFAGMWDRMVSSGRDRDLGKYRKVAGKTAVS